MNNIIRYIWIISKVTLPSIRGVDVIWIIINCKSIETKKEDINKNKVNKESTPNNHSFWNNRQVNGRTTSRKLGILRRLIKLFITNYKRENNK